MCERAREGRDEFVSYIHVATCVSTYFTMAKILVYL